MDNIEKDRLSNCKNDYSNIVNVVASSVSIDLWKIVADISRWFLQIIYIVFELYLMVIFNGY